MNSFDPRRTWRENLAESPPLPTQLNAHEPVPGGWSWCGLPLHSPLGIPAGPLLNARWLLYYANLGFDWLVYKTIRTVDRECYALPNLVPVPDDALDRAGGMVTAQAKMNRTWAVSFGMPSQSPSIWREDVAFARKHLAPEKRLIVSAVATQDTSIKDPKASLEQIADDFALAAKWAVESGADGIEANFSCPNVATSDGQLFQQPDSAGLVAARIRQAIGNVPLVLKIGHVVQESEALQLLHAVTPHVNGLAMTNSIAARVQGVDGEAFFAGQPRGICGEAIRDASVAQVSLFRKVQLEHDIQIELSGVGGISTASHVESYLYAGAKTVGLATSAMLQPDIALTIRQQLIDRYASK